MRTLEPEFIVPQHTRPLEGRDVIMSTLTAYRDAIQIVHDQTVRYMNKGLNFPLINNPLENENRSLNLKT